VENTYHDNLKTNKNNTHMTKLKIHCLQHVSFEGLGCIENWISENDHSITYTKFYEAAYSLPDVAEIDWLIIMGGPMGVYDENKYNWLVAEKSFIKQAIENGKVVVGICLGSQLIAEVLGAKVYPNKVKEIGWFNIHKTENANVLACLSKFENNFAVFHWHGDTFDLPTDSIRLFSSDVCTNQAFIFNNKVLGLQFHLEVSKQTLSEMVEKGMNELTKAASIQTATEILSEDKFIVENNRKMYQLLNYLAL
jgi:GMP synthase-like glutamine amidotransferase